MNYETPMQVDSTEGLYFYHTMTLPNGKTIEGDWDLRPALDAYLGRQSFAGKRCLDIGTATGFLTFAMEERGASEVVSFDQSEECGFDLLEDWKGKEGDSVQRMKRSYWYCHKQMNSKAKVVYGNIYNLPRELGQFDYAMVGSILLHLESPVALIRQAASLAKRVIITDVHRPNMGSRHMVFRPAYPDNRDDYLFWWYIPMETIINMLESFGMKIEQAYTFKAGGKICGETAYYCVVAAK